MGNTDTSPLNDWVKRELIPALVSSQMEMEQVLDSDELFPAVFIAWLNDKKRAGVCDD